MDKYLGSYKLNPPISVLLYSTARFPSFRLFFFVCLFVTLTSKLHLRLTTSVIPASLWVLQNMARCPVIAYSGRRTHWGCWQRLLTTSIMPGALCRLRREK